MEDRKKPESTIQIENFLYIRAKKNRSKLFDNFFYAFLSKIDERILQICIEISIFVVLLFIL